MFNGIIENKCLLNYLKFILFKKSIISFLTLKINYFFYLNTNLGFSFTLNGICLTLSYKYFNFIEFYLSYETFILCNFFLKFINIEKSLFLFNNINGYLSYGHINNIFFLKKKYIYNEFLKICFLCGIFLKKFIFYKYSIFINGVNLTINKIEIFNKYFIFYINIINFTLHLTNFIFNKIFDFSNIELDLTLFFLLNFLYLY